MSYEIAVRYGHRILYTPPYHPELQPIEKIWGVVKNRRAQDPCDNVHELMRALKEDFEALSSNTWIGSYRRVQQQEREYLANAPSDDFECVV